MNYLRQQIVNQARSYLDTPFLHLGRTKKGLDCVGLIVRVAKDLNLSEYDLKKYSRLPDLPLFMKSWRSCSDLTRKSLKKRLPGDIIIVALPYYPCHVGFLSEKNTIIHALSSRNKVCEHRISNEWLLKFRECFSFNQIED